MYEDGADAAGGPVHSLGGAVKKFNLEGLIPLILLVIIGVASLNYFGVIDVPFLPKGSERVQVLFIGTPSLGEKTALDNLNYFLNYTSREASSFGNAAAETLQQYDIVILDQSNSNDKSVSVALSESIQNYVRKGGKLIIVMNSAIYSSVGFQGYTAADAIGWQATLGKISPAYCGADHLGVPTCKEGQEINLLGRIWRQDFDHPIMQGIEVAPAIGDAPFRLTALPITADAGAKTIAYMKAENTPQTFPAILEKKSFPMGTVIYFNYDPGYTQTILKNTIDYLK
jgi:hypothetical protein